MGHTPENLSIGERAEIVMGVIRLTETEELWWEPTGDPNSFTCRRGRATAVMELTEAPERVRLRFHEVDGAVGDVVIEQTDPADGERKELKMLNPTLDKLWRIAKKLAVPSAADLFLRGTA